MNLLAVRAEIEQERTWRAEELRFLHNQMVDLKEAEREQFRRAILLLLYSHFEGFCGVTLRIYVREVNELGLQMEQVTSAVAAAACRPILLALSDQNSKHDFFRRGAPSDSALHFAWRSQHFLERLSEIGVSTVSIPPEIVDTESNLWPVVLKKNLFRLGLDVDAVAQYDATIYNLVNRRNNIGHGMERFGLAERVYEEMQRAVYDVMDGITMLIMNALAGRVYLRRSSGVVSPSLG